MDLVEAEQWEGEELVLSEQDYQDFLGESEEKLAEKETNEEAGEEEKVSVSTAKEDETNGEKVCHCKVLAVSSTQLCTATGY